VDLCGGQGGFVEYLNWKFNSCKGWGITLHGKQDYDFARSVSQPKQFEIIYGKEDDGDICKLDNINLLSKNVENSCKDGVDLVLADGAFSVDGDDLYQEHHTRQLLACEILAMFKVLKKGGDFVIKVFDTITSSTIGLIYLLYLHFEKISMVKLLSSRPANSEKYVVCKGLQISKPMELIVFLDDVVQQMYHLKPQLKSPTSAHSSLHSCFIPFQEQVQLKLLNVVSILDPQAILKDTVFSDWIDDMNVK
jgi:cap1 methyltransferase